MPFLHASPVRILLPLLLFVWIATRLILVTPFPAPDELEHLSTAAQLQETGRFLPDYDNQTSLDLTDFSRWTTRRNYIGHPPPYYLLMARALDRTLPPGRAALAPRFVSLGLLLLGLALALAAGCRWFRPDAPAFWLFALGLALCPELLSIARQVTNDSLGILGGCIAYAAVAADRRLLVRDLGVAAGLGVALWAKPNAGVEAGLFLGVLLLLGPPARLRMLAAATLGGIIGVLPYVPIVWVFHALVPVAAEMLYPMPHRDGFFDYLPVFAFNLGGTWGFLKVPIWPAAALPLLTSLVFWLTAVAVAASVIAGRTRAAGRSADVALAAIVAFAVIVPIHFYFASARLGFSIAAASFRYDLPLWPGLAHAAAFAVQTAPTPQRRYALLAACACTMGLGWLL